MLIEFNNNDGTKKLVEIDQIEIQQRYNEGNNEVWEIWFSKLSNSDCSHIIHTISCPDKTTAQFQYDVITAELRSQIVCSFEKDIIAEREQRQLSMQKLFQNLGSHHTSYTFNSVLLKEEPKPSKSWLDNILDTLFKR